MSESRPVCVVTGGSEGIGRATVLGFAQHGHDIVTCGRRAAPLADVCAEVEALGGRCLTLATDLRTPGAGTELIHAALGACGRVDVLVNNAGYAKCLPIADLTSADLAETLAINVERVFETTRAVWPLMRSQGGGVIVNVSSLAAFDPFPGLNIYGAAKAWVNLFTKATAAEGRDYGIRAYALACGAVETAMLRSLFPDFPASSTLTPEAVADFILMLCDRDAAPASGETIICRR